MGNDRVRACVMIYFASTEDHWYATQAALLDPYLYHLITGPIDVVVPDGCTWSDIRAIRLRFQLDSKLRTLCTKALHAHEPGDRSMYEHAIRRHLDELGSKGS